MKKITVYGPGCPRCKQTAELVRRVVTEAGVAAEVAYVTDIREMAAAGILSTPAVAVDGVVRIAGRVPKAEEIRGLIGG